MIMEELSTSLEDYLETIYHLIESGNGAHVSQIADALEVSRPSVTQIIAKLADMGYVKHQPYRDIKLTARGVRVAKVVAHRHELFRRFLIEILHLPTELADEEACRLEHAIGQETTERFAALVEYITDSDKPPKWLLEFHNQIRKTKEDQS